MLGQSLGDDGGSRPAASVSATVARSGCTLICVNGGGGMAGRLSLLLLLLLVGMGMGLDGAVGWWILRGEA